MGADGGVCWVTLRKGKTRSDFIRVFEPWASDLLSEDAGCSWGNDSRYEFISANPHIGSCVGCYGTDIHTPSMEDLSHSRMPFLQESMAEGCETWRDVFMSVYTKPSWVWNSYPATYFAKWLEYTSPYVSPLKDSNGRWETPLDALWRHLESPEASPFWDQSIQEWMQELSRTVEGSWIDDIFYPHVSTEETWT